MISENCYFEVADLSFSKADAVEKPRSHARWYHHVILSVKKVTLGLFVCLLFF